MLNHTNRKTINIDKPNLMPLWTFKQEDDVVLNLTLFKDAVPFNIAGQTIRLGAKTNAGLKEQIDGFTIQGNNLDIALKNTILVPGPVEIDLEFTDAGGKMTSASFFINVDSKVLNDKAVEATNEFSTFKKTVAEIQEDYQGLRKIVIAENAAADLQDQVNTTNAQLEQKVSKGAVKKSDFDTSSDEELLDLNNFNEVTRRLLQGLSPSQINAVLGYKNVKKENIDDNIVGINNLSPYLYSSIYDFYEGATRETVRDYVILQYQKPISILQDSTYSLKISFDFLSYDKNIKEIGVRVFLNDNPEPLILTGGQTIYDNLADSKKTAPFQTEINFETSVSGVQGQYAYIKICPFIYYNTAVEVGTNVAWGIKNITVKVVDGDVINLNSEQTYKTVTRNKRLDLQFIQEKNIEEILEEKGYIKNTISITRWKDKRWLSIGDSITWQHGKVYAYSSAPEYGQVAVGYQQYVVDRLGLNLTNAGVSGMTMTKITEETNSFMKKLTSHDYTKYDLVTIALGVNDLSINGGANLGVIGAYTDTNFDDTTFYGAYRKAIEHIINSNKNIKIVLMTPLERSNPNVAPNGSTLSDIANAIINLGNMYRLPVCDLHKNSGFNKLTNSIYTYDGLHPNNTGHKESGSYLAGFISCI